MGKDDVVKIPVAAPVITCLEVEEKKIVFLRDITVDMPFEVVCAVPKMPFGGTIRVNYVPGWVQPDAKKARLLEWNSLNDFVRSFRKREFLAEEFLSFVTKSIYEAISPEYLMVSMQIESPYHLSTVLTAEVKG